MIKLDKDALMLCKIQGEIFEKSLDFVTSSSEVFIRRFMNSNVAKDMDCFAFLNDTLSISDVFLIIENEFGKTNYGKTKLNRESLFWIGYIYRYFSCTYQLSSKQVYNIVKPKELNQMYYVYHTFDCTQAIERILEEKKIRFDNPNERLLKIIRNKNFEHNVSLKETNSKTSLKNDNIVSKNEIQNKETAPILNVADKYLLNGYISLAIVYKNDEVIGKINFIYIDKNTAEMCVVVDNENYKNKGYNVNAIKKGLKYAKKDLNVKSIIVKILPEETAIQQELKDIGFYFKTESDNFVYFNKSI